MATNPVCGMDVSERNAASRIYCRGRAYCICSPACHKAFSVDPRRYAAPVDAGAGLPASMRPINTDPGGG